LDRNIEYWPDAQEKKDYFKTLIGRLIRGSKDHIALTLNTSAGLNILTLGLDWKPGDRILLNNFEFPSNVIPFLNLRRSGVEIDYVQHREGAIVIDDIAEAIRPETRLLSISFVGFLNGFRNDLGAISQLCHDNGMIMCVDAIQGLGALGMNMEEMGIDFLSSGGHKWLMWPSGIGFVYISPDIMEKVHPAQAGWLSVEDPFDFFNYEQPFASTAQRFEPGVFNIVGMIAATASLEMMLEIGSAEIEEKILSNTQFLINQFEKLNLELLTHADSANRSGIVTFQHPDSGSLFEYLKNKNITVSLRDGKIRVSPHFYNDENDLERFIYHMKIFQEQYT
jgi:selenocysteine lyase/cysteine desulfurase